MSDISLFLFVDRRHIVVNPGINWLCVIWTFILVFVVCISILHQKNSSVDIRCFLPLISLVSLKMVAINADVNDSYRS